MQNELTSTGRNLLVAQRCLGSMDWSAWSVASATDSSQVQVPCHQGSRFQPGNWRTIGGTLSLPCFLRVKAGGLYLNELCPAELLKEALQNDYSWHIYGLSHSNHEMYSSNAVQENWDLDLDKSTPTKKNIHLETPLTLFITNLTVETHAWTFYFEMFRSFRDI